MQVTFLGSEPTAHNIRTFHFKPKEPVKQIAGQFIQMVLPHDNPDDRGIKRWFTVSSSPTDSDLMITTKFAGDKSSSFKKTLFGLEPGTTLEMVVPEGDFTLPDDKDLELIFIAGGIGVTPYHSMIKYLADKGEKRQITLVYGAQTKDELAFMDLFKSYGVHLQPVIGERMTTESLMKIIGDPAGKLIYLSGPEPMVEALTDSLVKAGLPADKLKSDYFPGYENQYSN
jgi:ferredoxin-NADP reductase